MYSNNLICNILDYIDININTKISIEDLEKKFYYNRYYIMKLFKKELNITILDYINKLRIYNSIEDLMNDQKIIKIALNNGFYSLEYYSELFKKEIGISPREYRKIAINNYYHNKKTNIIRNVIDINTTLEKINRYKQNRKREVLPVKKLTIFK